MRWRQLIDVGVPMRDGTRLSADLYLPEGGEPRPAILVRTPYDNAAEPYVKTAVRFAAAGYAVALQDCRGRYDSEGRFAHFDEVADGVDTVAWVGEQDWCDGQVAMTGLSYDSWVQLSVATSGSPHLRCLAPAMMTATLDQDLIYNDGALQLSLVLAWLALVRGRTMQNLAHLDLDRIYAALPAIEADLGFGSEDRRWRDWLSWPADDERWATYRVEDWNRFDVPLLQTSGWFDYHAMAVLDTFNAVRASRSEHAAAGRVIIGPWKHEYEYWTATEAGEMDCGPEAAIDLPGIELEWFDRWMKGGGSTAPEAPLRLFVMGRNVWRDEYEWPLARTDWRNLYLHADGLLTDGEPAADGGADDFLYDPADPVPTVGGPCEPAPGARDRRAVALRHDVLAYSSEPLAEELEVTGPVSAVLFVETDAPSTAWSVNLVDVAPDGRAWGLCEALVDTARSVGVRSLGEENGRTLQRVDVRIGVTSYVFPAGHQIRLEVSSSNFPRFARNLNGGGVTADAAETRTARQRVHHRAELPSHLILPTIPPQRGETR